MDFEKYLFEDIDLGVLNIWLWLADNATTK